MYLIILCLMKRDNNPTDNVGKKIILSNISTRKNIMSYFERKVAKSQRRKEKFDLQ